MSWHSPALAAVQVEGAFYAGTGANPDRAREALSMILRRAGRDPTLAADAATINAPDAGPWSFHSTDGLRLEVSRPGALDVDTVDMWDAFDFDLLSVPRVTEFLRLCQRWLNEWADRFERDGD